MQCLTWDVCLNTAINSDITENVLSKQCC